MVITSEWSASWIQLKVSYPSIVSTSGCKTMGLIFIFAHAGWNLDPLQQGLGLRYSWKWPYDLIYLYLPWFCIIALCVSSSMSLDPKWLVPVLRIYTDGSTGYFFWYLNLISLQPYINLHQILVGHIYDIRHLYIICEIQVLEVLVPIFLGYHACKYVFRLKSLVGIPYADLIPTEVSYP